MNERKKETEHKHERCFKLFNTCLNWSKLCSDISLLEGTNKKKEVKTQEKKSFIKFFYIIYTRTYISKYFSFRNKTKLLPFLTRSFLASFRTRY